MHFSKSSTLFPKVRLLQTYGLSEVGILRSKSKSSDSLWVKVGGEEYQTRVIDGMLEIKAKSAMLGYLNAPSPFTEDGWFKTNDAVLVDGEYMKILGRKSEIINVGGEKVYPAEVERLMRFHENVDAIEVYGEVSKLQGHIVKAKIKLYDNTTENKKLFKRWCLKNISHYKVPKTMDFF